jgi:hypothetical protein
MSTTGYDSGPGSSETGYTGRRGNGPGARFETDVGKPISVLFRDVLDKIRGLLRDELQLAKAEMREQVALVGRNLAWISVGAGLALAAVLVLCLAINRGLTVLFSQFMDPEIAVWLVPLLLALVLAGVGAALVMKGVKTLREHMSLVPERTKQTLKEDREWLRQKVT